MNTAYNSNTPKFTWGSKWGKKAPTAKQIDFIQSLAQKLGVTIINTDEMDRFDASHLIHDLQEATPTYTHYLRRDQSKFVQFPAEA